MSVFRKKGFLRGRAYFFRAGNVFFSSKECIFAARKPVRRMLVRIQYLLFVSLFILLSAVPPVSERSAGKDSACATLRQQQDPLPAPARFCFATVCNGGECAGLLDPTGSKSPVRFDACLRSEATSAPFAPLRVHLHDVAIPFRAVDYYVFSLGHILI